MYTTEKRSYKRACFSLSLEAIEALNALATEAGRPMTYILEDLILEAKKDADREKEPMDELSLLRLFGKLYKQEPTL